MLVEYGDFECPFCGMADPEIKVIRQRLGDRLRFVYRHLIKDSQSRRTTTQGWMPLLGSEEVTSLRAPPPRHGEPTLLDGGYLAATSA
jgi:hypothetical protein